MADTYTIAAAARLCHVDRRTLQRAITAGRLALDAEHRLSREDLIAAGYWFTEGPLAAPQAAPQATPRPAPRGTPDVDAAHRRMLALQGEGLTLAQIAARLTQEGYRTRHGRPWHKSTVSYVLRTHGR